MKSVFTTLSIIFFSFYAQAWIFSPAEVSGSINLNSSSSLTISNNSGVSQSMNLSVSHPALSISLNRCTGNLLNNRTCSVSFAINASLMPVGETIIALNNNGSAITNLKYVKNAPLEFSQFDRSSASLSDFSQQSIYITNKTLSFKSYNPTFSGADASKFSIVLNRCTNIGVNKSCQIVYRLKSPQLSGSYSAQLTEPQVQGSVNISASISESVPGVIPPVVSSLSVSTNSLNFGNLTQYGQSSAQNVLITNTGNSSISPIIEISANAGLVLNRCTSLSAGQSCSISVGLKPAVGTPNGALSESVLVKKNSGDSGLSISLIGNLNVIAGCPVNQHLESGSCVANVRSCSISNGSGNQTWNAGSWGACNVSSCNSGYYQLSNSCALITYSAIYSSYSPNPSSIQICDGTVTSTRTVISCMRDDNFELVSNSNCVDLASSISTQSPAGNINVSISNGSEVRSCALGSSSQSFVSRSCDSGYHDNGLSCEINSYIATYSDYSPSIPSSLNACDGTIVSNRTITDCKQAHDNQSVSTSFCSDSSPSVTTQSPAGTITVSISNGSENFYCDSGSTNQVFSSRTCNTEFFDNGSSCQPIVYIPVYSAYSPAIPSSLNACDGTVISTRSLDNCYRQHDSVNVGAEKCPSDPNSTVITQSPAGSINVSISNGSETLSCALGSSTQTLVSRTCNSGYIDNGSICEAEISFVSLGLNNNGVLKNNNAYLWGTDGWGALGNGTTTGSATPVQPSTSGVLSGKTLTAITLGNKVLNRNFMCAIASDGLPYCWGAGTSGGLGNGGTANSSVPVAVTTSGVLSGKTILKIANSAQSACVIASDNKVYCWGRNNEGELGTGSTTPTSSSVPVAITSGSTLATKNAVSIYMSGSGSTSYAYVLTSDGQLFSWGDNTNGQLCRGGSFSATPTAINLSGLLAGRTITNVVLAGNSTYIQTSDGKAFACGANSLGQLGIGTSSTSVTSPTEISTANFPGKTIKKISSAGTFGCLINSDDLPFCWGQNLSGKTGLNLTSGNTLSPTAVVLTGDMASKTYIDIETNGSASYFLSNDKKLYSTGGGFGGVLGNGGTTDVAVPGPIAGTLNTLLVNKIYAGNNQACAVTSLNKLYCWGSGNQNGTSSGAVSTPALVNIP